MIHSVRWVPHLQVIRTQTGLRKWVYLEALGYLLPSEETLNHLIKHKGQELRPSGDAREASPLRFLWRLTSSSHSCPHFPYVTGDTAACQACISHLDVPSNGLLSRSYSLRHRVNEISGKDSEWFTLFRTCPSTTRYREQRGWCLQ